MEEDWHPRAAATNLRLIVSNELIHDINSKHTMIIIIYYLRYRQLFIMFITPNQLDAFPVKFIYSWFSSIFENIHIIIWCTGMNIWYHLHNIVVNPSKGSIVTILINRIIIHGLINNNIVKILSNLARLQVEWREKRWTTMASKSNTNLPSMYRFKL